MREGWEYKKLGDCLSYIKNGANIKQTKGAIGIPVTRIETLAGGIFNRDRLGYANIFSIEKYIQNILNDGDILMSHINSKTYIGRSVLYKRQNDEQIIHGMNLLRLKSIPSIIISTYLNIIFQTNYFRNNVAKIRKDAVNQSSMTISDLIKIPIPVPPLSEQERIVSELDLLASIIDKKKEQLKEYEKLAQSIFYDMFGDPVQNEKGWEVKKLGEVCKEIGDGLHGTPQYDPDGKIAFINGNNLKDGKIIFTNKTLYVSKEEAQKMYKKLDTNTILLSINGTLGKTAIYNNENIVLGKSACYCKITNRLNVIFVMSLMNTNSFQDFLENNSSKSTIKNVGLKTIRNYRIILPPLSLQQSFAEKVEAIEKQKTIIQQSINETQTLFNSRMDYYFG